MKHIQSSILAQSKQLCTPILVKDVLTECDVLLLQDVFLCNGFHHIQVKNIYAGRKFMYTFLQSLAISGEIGCLTGDILPLDDHIIDIQNTIRHFSTDGCITEEIIEQFFNEEFFYDFIWIEISSEFEKKPWYIYFKKKLLEYKHMHIPIAFLTLK